MSGIIKSQSIQFSLISYVGVVIGILSTLFIYPQDLSLYGLYGFLTNAASLFAPLVSLGFGAVVLRYFPFFRTENGRTDGKFYFLVFIAYAIGIICFLFFFFLFKNQILSLFNQHDEFFISNFIYLAPLIILFVLFELLTHIANTHKSISFPALLSNLFKVFLPLIFLLCIKKYINYKEFLICILLYYGLILIILFFYLRKFEKIQFVPTVGILHHPRSKEMIKYAFYSVLTGTSAVLALRIDSLMISSQINLEANGKFIMAYFISNAVFIPAFSINEILTSFVSQNSKENNHQKLLSNYNTSIRNMLIPTLWASLMVYLCFDQIVQLLPSTEKLIGIKNCLALLLLARIAEAGTGVNHHILSFSKFYKFELVLLLSLMLINITLNILFIPLYHLTGVALATLISLCVFNFSKTIFIYYKLNLQPYDKKLLVILAFAFIAFVGVYLIPPFSNPLWNIGIQFAWLNLIFLILIFYTEAALEMRSAIKFIYMKYIEAIFIRISN